jgi:hypothetical protein
MDDNIERNHAAAIEAVRLLYHEIPNECDQVSSIFAEIATAGEIDLDDIKSTRGNTCCQLFVMNKGYNYVVSMRIKGDVLAALFVMKELNCPIPLWDDCVERRTKKDKINSIFMARTLTPIRQVRKATSPTCTHVDGMSSATFEIKVKVFPSLVKFSVESLVQQPVSGNEMAQWVLKASGDVVPRRTLRPLQAAEPYSPEEKKRRDIFDVCIERMGTSSTPPSHKAADELRDTWEEWGDDDEDPRVVLETEDTVDANGGLLYQQPAYEQNH